jgi:hypothetical protein
VSALFANASFAKSPRIADALVICGGVVSGLLTPQILEATDHWFAPQGFTTMHGPVYSVGAIPFAILIGAITRLAGRVDWWRSVGFAVATLVIMALAITTAANLAGVLGNLWSEPVRELIAGPGGGLVGAGLMVVVALLLGVGPRNALRWLPLVVIGVVLGSLLAVDSWRDSEKVWVVFPAWQAGVAFVVLRTLRAWRAAELQG